MKLINWALFSIVLLVASQGAWAVMVKNGGGGSPPPATNATGTTTERGGIVTAVNRKARTISVDGVTYPIAPSLTSLPPGLKKNMKILFSTTRFYGQDKVSAITITAPR